MDTEETKVEGEMPTNTEAPVENTEAAPAEEETAA